MAENRSAGLSLEELTAAANEFVLTDEQMAVKKDEDEFKDWVETEEPPTDNPPACDPPIKKPPAKKPPVKQPPVKQPADDPIINDPPADIPVPAGPPSDDPVPAGPPSDGPVAENPPGEKPAGGKPLIGGAPAAIDGIPFFGVMYRAFKYKRYGLLVWVILNAIAVGLVCAMFTEQHAWGLGFGILIYVVTQMIVVGAVGDHLLKNESGCAVIKDKKILNRLQPIFDRVYEDARAVSPHISSKVRFCMSNDEFPNAYASGRTTICITKGLLDLSDDKIEGILAHEFGHMANRDTDESQVIWVGNIFISLFLSVLGFITMLLCAIFSSKDGLEFMSKVGKALQAFIAITLINVWVMLGTMICGMSNRQEEYDADLYAAQLGRGDQLVAALADIDGGSGGAKGLWKALNSSHPNTEDRIMRILNYEQESGKQLGMTA